MEVVNLQNPVSWEDYQTSDVAAKGYQTLSGAGGSFPLVFLAEGSQEAVSYVEDLQLLFEAENFQNPAFEWMGYLNSDAFAVDF